jgi:hypothetical protein
VAVGLRKQLKKLKFIANTAIQLKAKFAIGFSHIKNSLNGYFLRETGQGAKGDAGPWGKVLFKEKDEAKATRSPSRIFFEKKDEAFFREQNPKKLKISSRIRRFTRREGSSRLKNSLNGYF